MDIEQTILLGIIQGLTEFLPISSSGHLVIFQHLIGLKNPELLLDISLHLGTLLAVLIFFWTDVKMMITESAGYIATALWKGRRGEQASEIRQFPHAALAFWIFLGIIPTALIGIIFGSLFHEAFGSTLIVGIMLMVTGTILGVSRLIPDYFTTKKKIGLISAVAVGLAQGAAITPGISRSGTTIVCGLFCGLDRDLAGRFSFLISIPAIIGALVLKFDMTEVAEIGYIPFLTGIATSFLVGLLALKITMAFVRGGKLHYFFPYCFLAGTVAIFVT
jgi:undecaprenyl-diphosphatase